MYRHTDTHQQHNLNQTQRAASTHEQSKQQHITTHIRPQQLANTTQYLASYQLPHIETHPPPIVCLMHVLRGVSVKTRAALNASVGILRRRSWHTI